LMELQQRSNLLFNRYDLARGASYLSNPWLSGHRFWYRAHLLRISRTSITGQALAQI
jgi:hypothetical protein